jgi:hypothetical protein
MHISPVGNAVGEVSALYRTRVTVSEDTHTPTMHVYLFIRLTFFTANRFL